MKELVGNLAGYIVLAFVALGGAIGVYFKGRKDANAKATAAAETKQAQAQATKAAEVVAEAKHEATVTQEKANAQADVIRMPVGAAADRLRAEWSRD